MTSEKTTGEWTSSTCSHKFKRKQDLLQHEQTYSRVKPFTCRDCAKCFSWRFSLNCYFRKFHEGPVPKMTQNSNLPHNFECEDCKRWFTSVYILHTHIIRNHPNNELPPFKHPKRSSLPLTSVPSAASVPSIPKLSVKGIREWIEVVKLSPTTNEGEMTQIGILDASWKDRLKSLERKKINACCYYGREQDADAITNDIRKLRYLQMDDHDG